MASAGTIKGTRGSELGGGEGGWHLNETTCKGGILFACAHPTPRVPTPCLSWCPNRMIHLPYLSLPLPPRVLCPGQGCKYSQKRDPCNRSPATLLPAAPAQRAGPGGPFRGQAEGGAPGAACWGSPSCSVLLRGTFRVLTVKWGLFGPSMGQFFVLSGVSVFRFLLDVLSQWARVG